VTDIATKSNSPVVILCKAIDFKIPVFDPFSGPPVRCFYKNLSLPMHINSMWEFQGGKGIFWSTSGVSLEYGRSTMEYDWSRVE
jgi:hypothetical protein